MTLFKIRNIDCLVEGDGDEIYCSKLDYLLGRSLLFTDLEKTDLFQTVQVNELGQVYLPIAVKKKLPSTLMLEFVKEDPLYRLKIADNIFVVNSYNFLTNDIAQFQLPEIELSTAYNYYIADNKIDSRLNSRLYSLVEGLAQENIVYDGLFIDNESSFLSKNGIRYLFDDNNQLDQLPIKIKLITQDFSQVEASVPLGSKITTIDLRFELPVVSFEGEGN